MLAYALFFSLHAIRMRPHDVNHGTYIMHDANQIAGEFCIRYGRLVAGRIRQHCVRTTGHGMCMQLL